MKVALFIPAFLQGVGGAEKVAAQVANLVCEEGGKAVIVCNRYRSNKVHFNLAAGVNVRPIDINSSVDIRSLAHENFDVLAGFGMFNFFARLPVIGHLLGKPLIIQECTNPYNLCTSLMQDSVHACMTVNQAFWLRQAVLAHAQAVRFTLPNYGRSVVEDVAPFVYAFPNAFAAPMPCADQPATGGKRIICVGAFKDANKNGMLAARGFAKFSAEVSGFELHIFGMNIFSNSLNELRVANEHARIIDHGIVKNPAEIFGNARALVISSFDEGLPNVVVEAFSYGVPCVGFADCPGVRDLIEHRVNGFLLNERSDDAIAAALKELSSDALCKTLAEGAKATAESFLDLTNWRQNWLRMLNNAAAGLDCHGQKALPAARNIRHPRHKIWQEILDPYAAYDSDNFNSMGRFGLLKRLSGWKS